MSYSLCCISNELKEQGVKFRTMTWKRFNQLIEQHDDRNWGLANALHSLGEVWINNIEVTYKTIKHCAENGWGYRVSSSLFPLATHPDFMSLFENKAEEAHIPYVFQSIEPRFCYERKEWVLPEPEIKFKSIPLSETHLAVPQFDSRMSAIDNPPKGIHLNGRYLQFTGRWDNSTITALSVRTPNQAGFDLSQFNGKSFDDIRIPNDVRNPDYAKAVVDGWKDYRTHLTGIEGWFAKIRELTKETGIRLSTHPDQFNVLASENKDAVKKTINELNFQGWVMDMLGAKRSYESPMNIHVNCTKGELADIASRFMDNLAKCDESVQSRLVVENEDKGCWNGDNLLKHFRMPITYDNLHDKCNPSETKSEDLVYQCAATWPCKPLFHYSESHPDKPNPRSHADMPLSYPTVDYYDYEVELKSKDFAIRECQRLDSRKSA